MRVGIGLGVGFMVGMEMRSTGGRRGNNNDSIVECLRSHGWCRLRLVATTLAA